MKLLLRPVPSAGSHRPGSDGARAQTGHPGLQAPVGGHDHGVLVPTGELLDEAHDGIVSAAGGIDYAHLFGRLDASGAPLGDEHHVRGLVQVEGPAKVVGIDGVAQPLCCPDPVAPPAIRDAPDAVGCVDHDRQVC